MGVSWLVGLAACACVPVCTQAGVSKEHHLLEMDKLDLNVKNYQDNRLPMRSDVMAFMENCTHWETNPMYAKRWVKKKEIRDEFRTLHEEYGLRCCPKPKAGGMVDLGFVDTGPLKQKLEEFSEEIWLEDAFRQQKFKVHAQTESILFVWRSRLMVNTEEKPRWRDFKPYLEPAVRQACKHYGYDFDEVDIWKAMLARLPPGASILPHPDAAPALNFPHRIHWAISGEEGVRTMIGRDELQVKDGQLFEFNNVNKHSVSNEGSNYRIHAIFDLVPKKLPVDIEALRYPEPEGRYYGYQDYDEEEDDAMPAAASDSETVTGEL